jgi:RNA polymerase sigma factor (sigma-70 family)
MAHDGCRRPEVTVRGQDFEEHRADLRAVAYRMLGSFADADDAVQEAWLRLRRADPDAVRDLGAWLTTVVARVCLDVLRTRRSRRELSLDAPLPDPVVVAADPAGPEDGAVRADEVSLALLVVLETLAPPERVAFVLHDLFAVPYDEIAPVVGRTALAARQLASRARRRLRGSPIARAEPDRARQRKVVEAFLSAAHGGDLAALLALLDPDVELRADVGAGRYRGADAVAHQAMAFSARAAYARPAWVNGAAGLAVVAGGRTVAVLGFTVGGDRIVEVYVYGDPERLSNKGP